MTLGDKRLFDLNSSQNPRVVLWLCPFSYSRSFVPGLLLSDATENYAGKQEEPKEPIPTKKTETYHKQIVYIYIYR